MFNNEKHLLRAKSFRDWGRMGDDSEIIDDRFNHKVDGIPYDHKFLYSVLGYNMKCSEMNAAFGLVQLEKFNKFEHIRRANFENKDILGLTEAYKEIFATKNLTENLSKLNGEFKENPLVKKVIEFITKDKKRSICTPFSKE